jgi:cell division protein FtsQ
VGAIALVAAAVVAVLFTPALGVHSVRVTGTHVLSPQRVLAAAKIEQGTPVLGVDTAAVRNRVAGIPQVASVTVSRSLPFTVDIDVTERAPVAVFDSAEGVRLVDRTGLPYLTVPKAPPALPRINLPEISPKDPGTHAVVAVLAALPATLRARITSITASRQGDVRFALDGGKKVTWGTPEHSRRKAAVLKVLLTREGTVYNVTSPDLPAVS